MPFIFSFLCLCVWFNIFFSLVLGDLVIHTDDSRQFVQLCVGFMIRPTAEVCPQWHSRCYLEKKLKGKGSMNDHNHSAVVSLLSYYKDGVTCHEPKLFSFVHMRTVSLFLHLRNAFFILPLRLWTLLLFRVSWVVIVLSEGLHLVFSGHWAACWWNILSCILSLW